MKKVIFDVILAMDDKLSIKIHLSNKTGTINFKKEIRQRDFIDLTMDNNGEPFCDTIERQYKEFADELGFEFETTAEYERVKKEYLESEL